MSVESISWALNLTSPSLRPSVKLVLIGICNHDGDGGAWPSMSTLARYAGLSERQARRCVEALEALGLIERRINDGGGRGTPNSQRPNLYVVHRPDAHDRPPPVTSDRNPRSPMSAEPSLNRPTPQPPKGGRRRRRHEDHECRRDYDHAPLTPEELHEKYGVEP